MQDLIQRIVAVLVTAVFIMFLGDFIGNLGLPESEIPSVGLYAYIAAIFLTVWVVGFYLLVLVLLNKVFGVK